MRLNKRCGNHPAQRMAPRDGSLGLTDHYLDEVEHRDLVRYGLMNSPSGRGVRGSRQCETTRKHKKPRDWVSHVVCRVWTAGSHIPVAVEKQSPVPVCRNFDQISCAVSKCSGLRSN